jgi:hypothetical protein
MTKVKWKGFNVPVTMSWYLPGRIILTVFEGEVTAEEIRAASEESVTMLEASEAPLIHFIHDGSLITRFPGNLKEVVNAFQVAASHPKLGWTLAHDVKITAVDFIGNLAARVFRVRYRILDSRQDVLAFLQEVDVSLPDLC